MKWTGDVRTRVRSKREVSAGLQQTTKADGLTQRVDSAKWAVGGRFLIHGLVAASWVSRIPAIQSALRLTNAQLGFCLLATAVGSMLAVPMTGWLISRFGSKQLTSWSTLGFCLALATPSLAFNGVTLFCALALFGAMGAANDVAMNSQGVAVESALAAPIMSRFHAMFSIGAMGGAIIGGLIAGREVAARMHLCAASAILLLLSVATASHLLDADDSAQKHSPGIHLRRVPMVLVGLAVIGFCMFLAEGAIGDWGALYLKQVLGAGPGLAAAAFAAFSVGMSMFRLLGDHISARMGTVATVRRGALLAAAALSVALIVRSAHWALPCFALIGAGFAAIVPIVFGAGGRVRSVPSGAGVAAVSGSGYIGFLFGPPIIGIVAQRTSLRFALVIVVGLSLLVASLANAVRRDEADGD